MVALVPRVAFRSPAPTTWSVRRSHPWCAAASRALPARCVARPRARAWLRVQPPVPSRPPPRATRGPVARTPTARPINTACPTTIDRSRAGRSCAASAAVATASFSPFAAPAAAVPSAARSAGATGSPTARLRWRAWRESGRRTTEHAACLLDTTAGRSPFLAAPLRSARPTRSAASVRANASTPPSRGGVRCSPMVRPSTARRTASAIHLQAQAAGAGARTTLACARPMAAGDPGSAVAGARRVLAAGRCNRFADATESPMSTRAGRGRREQRRVPMKLRTRTLIIAVTLLSACLIPTEEHNLGSEPLPPLPGGGSGSGVSGGGSGGGGGLSGFQRCVQLIGYEVLCTTVFPVVCGGVSCASGEVCCQTTGACVAPGSAACPNPPSTAPNNPISCGSNADCASDHYCVPDEAPRNSGGPQLQRCVGGSGHCQPLANCAYCGAPGSDRCQVCGCDGVTYASDQVACVAGVSAPNRGRCGVPMGQDGGAFTINCGRADQCPAGAQCCFGTGKCFDNSEPWRCAP